MFFALLIVTLFIAALVSYIVARAFERPIITILERIVGPEIASAWARYMKFAIYVVGVSGGVRIYELERYLPQEQPVKIPDGVPEAVYQLSLTPERWVLEVYRTIIQTLQSLVWMLLVFFLLTLIAYVIVRIFGNRRGGKIEKETEKQGTM
jgi:ABC-type antimicrobial peptide transport system permease subunit